MKLSGKEFLEILQDIGFSNDGLSGNHFVVKKSGKTILIPDEEELAEKTVLSLIDQAGLSNKDILKMLSLKMGQNIVSTQDGKDAPSGSACSNAWSARGWLLPVAALRIVLGVMFLISALEKAPWVPGPFGWLPAFLESVASSSSIPLVKSLVEETLIPNITTFGWFQYSIELVLAITLILGFFTVLFACLGILWVAFFSVLAISLPDPFVLLFCVLWIASMMLVWSTRAGRSLGIDQALARKANERKEESGFWRFVSWLV